MNILEALKTEHSLLERLVAVVKDHAEGSPMANAPTEVCRTALAMLNWHAKMEDEILFTALEPHIGAYGPLVLIDHRNDHRQIDRLFSEAAQMGGGSMEKALKAAEFALAHFAKEEKVLFVLARRALKAEEMEKLGRRMQKH